MRRNFNRGSNKTKVRSNRYFNRNFTTNSRARNQPFQRNVSRVTRITTINKKSGTNNNNNNNRRVDKSLNQNNNRQFNNLKNKIEKLSSKLNGLSLQLFPKTTNLIRKKNNKEPRIDKAMTPMNMCLTTRYVSIFPTNNRFKYIPLYNKYEIAADSNKHNVIFFPYFVNFSHYSPPPESITVVYQVNVQPNVGSGFIDYYYANNKWNCKVYNKLGEGCGLYGSYRVVGATIKVTNVTAWADRGGSYNIYKLNDNGFYPFLWNSDHQPTEISGKPPGQEAKRILDSNKNNILIKQQFSSSEVGYVNEYNIYEGNNIFQSPWEYLGQTFKAADHNYAYWDNGTGTNVKYCISFDPPNVPNKYIIETWQVVEVIPDADLNLDIIAETQKYVYNEDVIKFIKNQNPISKSSL